MLIRSQRRMLLRVMTAYHMVSAKLLQVLRGVSPIDLLLIKRKRLYNRQDSKNEILRRQDRMIMTEEHQRIWDGTEDMIKMVPIIVV